MSQGYRCVTVYVAVVGWIPIRGQGWVPLLLVKLKVQREPGNLIHNVNRFDVPLNQRLEVPRKLRICHLHSSQLFPGKN